MNTVDYLNTDNSRAVVPKYYSTGTSINPKYSSNSKAVVPIYSTGSINPNYYSNSVFSDKYIRDTNYNRPDRPVLDTRPDTNADFLPYYLRNKLNRPYIDNSKAVINSNADYVLTLHNDKDYSKSPYVRDYLNTNNDNTGDTYSTTFDTSRNPYYTYSSTSSNPYYTYTNSDTNNNPLNTNSNTPDIPNYSTDNNPLNTPGPYIQDSLDTLGSILKPEEPNNENLYT